MLVLGMAFAGPRRSGSVPRALAASSSLTSQSASVCIQGTPFTGKAPLGPPGAPGVPTCNRPVSGVYFQGTTLGRAVPGKRTDPTVGIFTSPHWPAFGLEMYRRLPTYQNTDAQIIGTMHVGDHNTSLCPDTGGCWTEVGWEVNRKCGASMALFTYQKIGNREGCYSQYPIAPGQDFYVAITGSDGGTYEDWYWNGSWEPLDSSGPIYAVSNPGDGSPNVVLEVYIGPSGQEPTIGNEYIGTNPNTGSTFDYIGDGTNNQWEQWGSSYPSYNTQGQPYPSYCSSVYQDWFSAVFYKCG